MRTLITLLCLSLLVFASGCATTGEAAFYERQREDEAARAVQFASLADTSTCNGDATCVVAAKGFAALALAGRGSQPPQQYVPRPSTAAQIGLALIGQISPLASAAVAWRSSDNSVRTAEAQFGFLGGVVRDVSNASARSNEAAFGMLPSLQPSINAGGNLSFGDMQTAGNDLLGSGARVGHDIDIGAINTGTQVENSGIIGEGNRQNSPDDNSTICEGPGCQGDNRPITNPRPDEEGEG